MKKLFLSAIFLLLCSWILLFAAGAGLPTAKEFTAYCNGYQNQKSLMAENRILFSRIYTADNNGVITDVYSENRHSGNISTEITELAEGDLGIYFVREKRRDGAISAHDWELLRLSDGEILSLGGGSKTADISVTGLGVFRGEVNIAGIDDVGRAVLLTLPENGGEWKTVTHSSYGAIKATVTKSGLIAAFDDGVIALCDEKKETPVQQYPAADIPENISFGFSARLKCMSDIIPLTLIIAAVVTIVATLIMMALKARTIISGLTLTVGICLLTAFIIAGAGLCAAGIRQRMDQSLEMAVYRTDFRAQSVSSPDANIVLSDDFYTSEQYALMKTSLDMRVDTVFALKNGNTVSVLSNEYLCGSLAENVLEKNELSLIEIAKQGNSGGSSLFKNGRRYSISAAPIISNGIVTAVLFSRSPSDIEYSTIKDTIGPILLVLIIIYLAALILAHILLRLALKPVSQLTGQMQAVSDGDLTINRSTGRNDELGQLHDAMQEMCAGLSIRDYEVNSVIRSYRRFIPTDLHCLLNRASVMEVSFGDSNSITGFVSLYSVNNREAARTALNDNAFVDFVSDCFSQLYEQVMAHNGKMLSNGFDLCSIPVYYPDKPFDSFNAGLELTGKQGKSGMAPNFFKLLHYTTFMYGIAGAEERVFPFFSSGEIVFLNSYSDKFCSLGISMVATDAYIKKIDGLNGRNRYIGFVNSPDGKYSYKLYEILDVYSVPERTRKIKYDRQFQDAIRLFYHNDFYLARNQFSSILKLCPNDGMAKWYLFACEQAFNSDPDEIDYQLFGIS